MPNGMMAFSYRDLQKCAERETALRRNVYAKRGLTPKRLVEIEMMETIAVYFRERANELETRKQPHHPP